MDGRPTVRWGKGPESAAIAVAVWLPQRLDWSACRGMRGLLGFLDGDEARPVLLGLLEKPPADALLPSEASAPEPRDQKPQTLRLEGQQAVIIQCGKARIELRADGTVVMAGERMLSRSKGVNRIKGGSVQIN